MALPVSLHGYRKEEVAQSIKTIAWLHTPPISEETWAVCQLSGNLALHEAGCRSCLEFSRKKGRFNFLRRKDCQIIRSLLARKPTQEAALGDTLSRLPQSVRAGRDPEPHVPDMQKWGLQMGGGTQQNRSRLDQPLSSQI